MPQNCCVPHCTKKLYRDGGNKISFHKFPRELTVKREWIRAIRRDVGRDFTINEHTRVCSRHFKKEDFVRTLAGRRMLSDTAVPSVFSWKTISSPKKRKQPKDRSMPAVYGDEGEAIGDKEGHLETEDWSSSIEVDDYQELDKTIDSTLSLEDENVNMLKRRNAELEQRIRDSEEALRIERENCCTLTNQLCDAQRQVEELTSRLENCEKRLFSFSRFTSSKSISFYTGFDSVEVFNALYEFLDPGEQGENIRYWNSSFTDKDTTVQTKDEDETIELTPKQGRPRLLHPKEELFIVLCRLRQGFAEEHLSHLYGISQATISRLIINWVNFMYLRYIPMWPSREKVNEHMPEQFKEKYPSTRVIIDCTEVRCQMPSSLRLNSELFSSYKNHPTLKCLVGITPGGAFSFVSQLYTGHISDREIVLRSGFLDMLFENGDSVMADKGFTIQDLLPPGIGLNMPPFLGSQEQMNPEDVLKTQTIASLRVHVERAINKIKNFHIWDSIIPLNLFGIVNQMWAVCAFLCNLQKPIISA